MISQSRRQFLKWAAASGLISLSACSGLSKTAAPAQVVVIGGGFGGATVAKYIRLLDNSIKVILIEPKAKYITCPASNWLFAGMVGLQDLSVDYQALTSQYGVQVVSSSVTSVDTTRRRVLLADQQSITYDRLIMAPGIDFHWDRLPGYNQELADKFPHAWQAGRQTRLLQQQLQAMPAGGLVVITVPADPYRCPPGPYERASMIACWLKQHNPRAKLIILDAKTSFSKQKLFEAGWAKYFGYGSANSLIEWHALTDNPIIGLDAKTATLETYFGDKFQAQVLNIIPPQQAGLIARQTELTDAGGWCPVAPQSGLSTFQDNIHIIGDAANYAPIPKSAFAANSEAKVCALAVVSLLNQQPLPEAQWLNTCYSLVTPEHGISVAGVYQLSTERKIAAVPSAGGVSALNGISNQPQLEANYAKSVYRSLVADSFA
ncbi:FAD-dependent oxidoreductase [Methylomonas paludis]|uniref:FAD-dependent oxidoreductase n=1 Tax=Methylomonas paludis TaxID=1173101 RepID=A0A975R8N6_9GAMM|nr:NAD(P)/FAD-dependent oxidoreductase [Methylomonas paludis]QWF70595.1 FAD-dependent oxidoreductase [Methylomonas paludis]